MKIRKFVAVAITISLVIAPFTCTVFANKGVSVEKQNHTLINKVCKKYHKRAKIMYHMPWKIPQGKIMVIQTKVSVYGIVNELIRVKGLHHILCITLKITILMTVLQSSTMGKSENSLKNKRYTNEN